MLKKKKNLLFASSLVGLIVGATTIGATLSSCTTIDTNSTPNNDIQYSYTIDWDDQEQVKRLIIDDSGLVYSDNTKTTIIAISPKVMINTITIPDTVTSIAGYVKVTTNSSGIKVYQQVGAFQNITTLNTVIIPTGSKLRTIGAYAFSGCTGLNNINLENIIAIGSYAFSGAFGKNSNIIVSLPSITSIGASAFEASNIYGVDFSKSTNLYSLGSYAFRNSSNLTETVDLSNCTKLVETGGGSFLGCTSLTTVYIPSEENSSLKSISWHTFNGCTSLTTVGPKGTEEGSLVTTSSMQTIGSNAFVNTKITKIDASKFTVPSDQKYTGSVYSFNNMHYVTSVILPEGMTEIPINTTNNMYTSYFNGVGDLGAGFDIVLPSTITNIDGVIWSDGSPNIGAFYGSGVKSIDMSKIKSYSTSSSPNKISDSVFLNCSKLENVILKNGTSGFGNWVFSGCTNLKWIVEANEDGTYTTPETNGYSQSSSKTYGEGVFQEAFSSNSNAVIDLSNSTFTTLSKYMFDGSNIKEVKLPNTIVTIDESAFRNKKSTASKLEKVNFEDLINLTTINGNNFNRSSLTNIDLSNTKFSSISSGSGTTKSFTNLPTNAQAYLPNTLTSGFTGIFTDTNGQSISFNFPNGINSSFLTGTGNNIFLSNGILQNFATASNGSANVLQNVSNLNLSNVTSVKSIGSNTFFDSNKLTSLTLPASGIETDTNIFTAGNITSTNSGNTNDASSQYVTANIPFGNNEALTSLNYVGFSTTSTTNTIAESDTTAQSNLFNTTSNAWTNVVKIINSLSYQTYTTGESSNVSTLKANMSSWAAESDDASGNAINNDAIATFDSNSDTKKVTLTNSFTPTSSIDSTTPSTSFVINATDTTAKFIHNGIIWTYTNDGSTIKLTGQANMYKATNSSSSYLVFFNQTTYSKTDGSNTTYYVPSSTPVTVTLTIATTSNS